MTRTPNPEQLADRIEELKEEEGGLPSLVAVLRGEAELPPVEEVIDE